MAGSERTMTTRWKSVVDPSVKRASDEVLGSSEKSSGKMTAIWAGVGSAIGSKVADGLAWAAGRVKDFVSGSLEAASSLEQSTGAVEAVFKEQAEGIKSAGKAAADALGLSKNSYQELASVLGAGLKNKGLEDYADKTKELIQIGADLAAQYGGSTSDAVGALASLMRGERDPIERYGVTMNEAMVAAEAFALGLAKPVKNQEAITAAQNKAIVAQRKYNDAVKEHGKASDEALTAEAQLMGAQSRLAKAMEGTTPKLTDQQKAQASLSLLTKQTADAQGAFAREVDTAAGSQQRMAAKVENLQASLGEKLLPVQKTVLELMHNQFLPAVEKLINGFSDGITWVQKNGGELRTWATVLGIVTGGIGALVLQQKAMAAGGALKWITTLVQSTKLWTIAQGALNVVLNLNPIGIVVLAITALVAGIVLAYQKSETFRRVVDTAFKGIAAAGRWLWNNALQPVIRFLVEGFARAADGAAGLLEALGNVPGFGWAADAAKGLRDIASGARDAAAGIGQIPDPDVDTDQAQAQITELQAKIDSLKGKQVEAKARGDDAEVKRLQAEIDKLKGKKVKVEAQVAMSFKSVASDVAKAIRKAFGLSNGGIVRGYARGGFDSGGERHVAEIAPAGAMRLWAEPETGGEAYIPLAASKRQRSRDIWRETGRRLGVLPNEDGQVYSGSSAGLDGSPVDRLAEAIARLADNVLSREDMEQLLDELRRASSEPRPVVGVKLG
ncbi:MAG: hypothetical protein QM753_06785 [Thermomicrobiales bacterium]